MKLLQEQQDFIQNSSIITGEVIAHTEHAATVND